MEIDRAVLLLLSLLLTVCCQAQRLQQYCKFSPQHTLCRTTGLGKTCGSKIPVRGVTPEDMAVIVAQHNQLRARVATGKETRGSPGAQPKAANMMEMAWDEELALVAQRHADQCVFEHECADCREVERFPVGQNLFISFQSDLDPVVHWARAMQAWYDEVDLFAATGVDSYNFNPATGHYTQFVWAETALLGCGVTMYEEGGWYKKLYTCNYGRTGNLIFSPMYQRGEPCSACPQGSSCSLNYPGLCVGEGNAGGGEPAQSLAAPPSAQQQGRPNRNRPGGGNKRQGTSNNRQRGSNALGKAISPSGSQPFQIVQPFQLLSTITKSTLPPHPATGEAQNQQQLPSPQQFQEEAPSIILESGQATGTQKPPKSLPKIENLQNFLMNFGKTSQVIRTNSLDSVKAIINSLPEETQPLVFFRSNMGTLRQLRNLREAEENKKAPGTVPSRTVRSTRTPALQTLEEGQDLILTTSLTPRLTTSLSTGLDDMLLSCQDVSSPCPVVALSGNWTHGRDQQTNVVRTLLPPMRGGQLVLGQTIPPPASNAACVTLSYNFAGADRQAELPQVQVSVWPLGQVLLQEDLDKVSRMAEDGWLGTAVSFAPIRSPFMVVLSVEPNPGPQPVELALRGFMVTEGLCGKQ